MKPIVFTLILGCFVAYATKTKAQQMNLNQCIEYALKNNLTHANRHIESEIYGEIYRQSKRNLLPDIIAGSSANKRYGKSIDPTTNTFANRNFFSMNFYLDSQIDIFNGFTKINRIKFQKLRYLTGCEDVKQGEMEIIFAVMEAYYEVLYSKNLKDIAKSQLEISELNLNKTRKSIELGLRAESDLLEMQAHQATESHNLIIAENQYLQAETKLKKWMNYPLNEEIRIKNEENTIPENIAYNLEEIYQIALQHMPSVRRTDLETDMTRKNLAVIRGELFPQLSLGAGLSTNYADSHKEHIQSDNSSNIRTISFKDQWSQNMAKSVYLSLRIPIFSKWAVQSKIKKAQLEHAASLNKQKEERQNLYQAIAEDIRQINAFRKEIKLLCTKKKALREAYIISEKKMEQGLISIIEFHTAKNLLAQAEADFMRVHFQLKVKEQTVRFYSGKRLD